MVRHVSALHVTCSAACSVFCLYFGEFCKSHYVEILFCWKKKGVKKKRRLRHNRLTYLHVAHNSILASVSTAYVVSVIVSHTKEHHISLGRWSKNSAHGPYAKGRVLPYTTYIVLKHHYSVLTVSVLFKAQISVLWGNAICLDFTEIFM